MITKKIFLTTSSFLLTVCLTACAGYNFSQSRFQSKPVNYSAFTNLATNVSSLTSPIFASVDAQGDTLVTYQIINVIDKEIKKKINNTRFLITSFKKKNEAKMVNNKKIPKLEVISKSEDLSTYEINNKDLVYLHALSVEQIAFKEFSSNNLVASYGDKINDKVKVIQSSIQKTAEEPIDKTAVENKNEIINEESKVQIAENEIEDEEIVMFDYSNKNKEPVVAKTIDQRLYERPLSSTVKNVITREIGKEAAVNQNIKSKSTNTQKEIPASIDLDNQENNLEVKENEGDDYPKDITKKNNIYDEKALNTFVASEREAVEQVNTHFTIKAKEINLNTHKNKTAYSFEFIPDYERTERANDQSNGEINLEYSLSGDLNTQTGLLQSAGMISTRIELNLGNTKAIEIPLLNEEGIQLFLQKMGLSIEGNLILLAINNSIIDTEIDSTFAKRLFFDKDFKNLKSSTDAEYVMYAGVKNGNILIRYLLDNKESAQKIVYVGEGEMYFEDASFIKGYRETYTLSTRNILGHKNKELVIKGSDINFFNTNIEAKKKALNAYEIKIPTTTLGMRKYLEFKHLKDNIFVGATKETKIEIPENNFIAKDLELNQIDSLKDRCLVQINLSKDVKEIKANGKNRSGEMLIETSFLDSDGEFSRESDLAKNAFLVGDLEGQFSVRLDYTDGTTEFLKTFCSEGTYLVEQL